MSWDGSIAEASSSKVGRRREATFEETREEDLEDAFELARASSSKVGRRRDATLEKAWEEGLEDAAGPDVAGFGRALALDLAFGPAALGAVLRVAIFALEEGSMAENGEAGRGSGGRRK